MVKNFVEITISHCFRDKCVFAFYAEIQDGRQKWHENDFCRYPVGQKFRQNSSISHRFREKCVLRFMQKFEMAAKNGGKTIFGETHQKTADALRIKNFVKIALSHTVSEKNVFCVLCRNSRWPPKMTGKQFSGKLARRLCRSPADKKFCRKRSISHRF